VLLVLLIGALFAAHSVPAATTEGTYVALGDSYTAGWGVTPLAPSAPPECGQSAADYPHLVAAALGLSLTDVSCRGADTEDLIVAQSGAQPAQLGALTPSTDYVSLSIGGNDEDLFGAILEGCDEIDAGRPDEGAPCAGALEGFVVAGAKVVAEEESLALADIHYLSPHAQVFVVGYPEITPGSGYCPSAIPWTTGDLAWFRRAFEMRLNNLIRREARAAHAVFVNTFSPEGHNACTAAAERWIEPLSGSLTGIPMHPNALGEQHEATDLERAMKNYGVL